MATTNPIRMCLGIVTLGLLSGCADAQGFDEESPNTDEAPAVAEQAMLDALARQQFLLSRKNDIEYQLLVIQQRMQTLSAQASRIAVAYGNQVFADVPTANTVSPSVGVPVKEPSVENQILAGGPVTEMATTGTVSGSATSLPYETQQELIVAMNEQLQLRNNDLQTQLIEVATELKATTIVANRALEQSFKYQP